METSGSDLGGSFNDGFQEDIYSFIKILGRGTFGETTLYRRVKDKSLAVWKEKSLAYCSEEDKQNVEAQLEKISLVHHANIISYSNYFMEEQSLFFEVEYTNGGTLHEKIGIQDSLFGEEIVIWYFFQISSAMIYIHRHSILHRDIKTANIFLTKSGLVKLGDISLVHVTAEEHVNHNGFGIPYNSSPEFLNGKQYDVCCDMWALGCVLYELLTLRSVYEGMIEGTVDETILAGNISGLNAVYSSVIRTLTKDLLSLDPGRRPLATQVLSSSLFSTLGKAMEAKVSQLDLASQRTSRLSEPVIANNQSPGVSIAESKEVIFWGSGRENPSPLEEFQGINTAVHVSAGYSHFAAVTEEKELFTWAVDIQDNQVMMGQLGHGDRKAHKSPKKVEALQGIPIKMVSCGKEFTACLTDSGTMYTFGSDYSGCLGCNQEEGDEVDTPLEVTFFHGKPVERVSCGEKHILALTADKEVYSWGCGDKGRLGLQSEKSVCLPTKVLIPGDKGVMEVVAGADGSFFLTTDGKVLACGSNKDNKLGMNVITTGMRKTILKSVFEVSFKTAVTLVRPLARYNITVISAGKTHSAVVTEKGVVLTFGQNKYGQLGSGDFKPQPGLCEVKGHIAMKQAVKVSCGDGFTVVALSDFQVYSFGNTSNGRLGVSTDQTGTHRKRSAIPTPQPIFLSPCHVVDLSCCASHTVSIMEKVSMPHLQEALRGLPRRSSETSLSSLDDDISTVSSTTSGRVYKTNLMDPPNLPEQHYKNLASQTLDAPKRMMHLQSGMVMPSPGVMVPSPGETMPPPGIVPFPSVPSGQTNPSYGKVQPSLSSAMPGPGAHAPPPGVFIPSSPVMPSSVAVIPPPGSYRDIPQAEFIPIPSDHQQNAVHYIPNMTSESVQPHSIQSVNGTVARSGNIPTASPTYVPPSPRTRYPNHSRPPEDSLGGHRRGLVTSRKNTRKEDKMEAVLRRNRDLEEENEKLKKLVLHLEQKNEELSHQVNRAESFQDEIWKFVSNWEMECVLASL
ncbi:Serine/threonine-protein kinase Nek9 [Holothuria leucospilota]|uniref:non-specific serine/threonine protein kinase n=1 Tax=Holothuria leucospilota TaxID=206669 RepID=A0A9Q1CJ17_HOLLE|nr:Serine/threonine-protein kinase Nek9 [Holothuria leucospilota]